jgi:hypothetical protein
MTDRALIAALLSAIDELCDVFVKDPMKIEAYRMAKAMLEDAK